METKNFEEAVKVCDDGVKMAREIGGVDYVKLSKAMQRKGKHQSQQTLHNPC